MLTILQRSENLVHEIRSRRRKVVGWGTGSVFRSAHFRSALPIEYLVDNNPSCWNQTVEGLPVRAPDSLRQEDPSRLLVVIFSSFTREIETQLAALGPFRSIPASHLAISEKTAGQMRFIQRTADALATPPQLSPNPRHAIVLQGPIIHDVTLTALRFYRATQPDTALIVSSWLGQPESLVAAVEPWCDRCLLLQPPAITGRQNRNLQSASTLAGLNAAHELGAITALKTRSDCVLSRPQLAELVAQTAALYPAPACHAHGLIGRIALSSSYTRTWIPYHPADLVMHGAVEDLIRFWSLPPDTHPAPADWANLSLIELSRRSIPAEVHAGRCFAQSIRHTALNTIADSWAFYRDYFIVLDDDWLGLFWAKNPGGAPGITDRPSAACVSHAFWQQLHFGACFPPDIEAVAARNTWTTDSPCAPV